VFLNFLKFFFNDFVSFILYVNVKNNFFKKYFFNGFPNDLKK
jgi:hypothetical protein